MITAVDTNVLIDILEPDPLFGPLSKTALKACMKQGSIIACEVVWAEVATIYHNVLEDLLESLHKINLEYSQLSQEAALKAAGIWAYCRKAGGKRDRIAADFLIGGHAMTHAARLLTRDRGFFRTYFSNLEIIDPTK